MMLHDDVTWQPCREPLAVTLARNGTIAFVLGAVLAWRWGGLAHWPLATLLMLWTTFGGHWVEVWFLNRLRPRLPNSPVMQIGVRLVVWFIGGIVLEFGMMLTALAIVGLRPARWPAWWLAGLAFIGVELVVHGVLQLRGRSSFYNGRG